MDLMRLYDSGRVRRFHTAPDYTGAPLQSVAEHAWGVALIAMKLCERLQCAPTANLLSAALLHDAEEAHTGDLPAPTKWRFPALANEMRIAEEVVRKELGLGDINLTEREAQILKWADSLELYVHCLNRWKDGARAYSVIASNIGAHIRTNLPQWPEAIVLMKEIEKEFA